MNSDLAANASTKSFSLEQPKPTSEVASLISGRYQLGEVVGKGGMGLVRKAWDRELERSVAIKFLKPGVSNGTSIAARFRVEAKITGRLQHPGIPPVYQLGSLDDGLPFLAMKLVEGGTLAELLAERKNTGADVSRFLAIFEQICHAVGYAHSRDVIHRDLKPGNVMVGAHGEVQVMDWGFAKYLPTTELEQDRLHSSDFEVCNDFSRIAATTVAETVTYYAPIDTPDRGHSNTRAGTVIGTPAYMPPEQANGEIANLSARSDVFSLGGILFEMLVGRRLYIGETLEDILAQAVRCDLASAFSALDSARAEPEIIALCKRCLSVAQGDRPTDGAEVAHAIGAIVQAAESRARKAELERAVAVEETKRVKEIAEAEAKRVAEQTAAEKSKRKLVFRGLIGVSAALALGLVLSLWQVNRADVERDSKDRALIAQREANDRALAAIQKANDPTPKNLAKWQSGVNLITRMFKSIDPHMDKVGGGALQEHLRAEAESVARELDEDAKTDPVRLAKLQSQMAVNLIRLGGHQTALTLLEKSVGAQRSVFGPNDKDTLAAQIHLGAVYHKAARYAEAIATLEPTRDVLVVQLHGGDNSVLDAWFALASSYKRVDRFSEAEQEFARLADVLTARFGDHDARTVEALSQWADVLHEHGKSAKAGEVRRRIPGNRGETVKASLDTAEGLENKAVELFNEGKLDEALIFQERAYKAWIAKLGGEHDTTLAARSNYAGMLTKRERHNDAARELKDVFGVHLKLLGNEHPRTLLALAALVNADERSGRDDSATKWINVIGLDPFRKLDARTPRVLTALHTVAIFCGRVPECHPGAVSFVEYVLEVERRVLGADHPDRCNLVSALGNARWRQKSGPRPASKVEKSLSRFFGVLGASNVASPNDEKTLGVNLALNGRLNEGTGPAETKQIGSKLPSKTLSFVDSTLGGFIKAGSASDAEELIDELLSAERLAHPKNSSRLADQFMKYGTFFMAVKNYARAEALFRESATIREKANPDGLNMHSAHFMLGIVLIAQKRNGEAQLHFTKCIQGAWRAVTLQSIAVAM